MAKENPIKNEIIIKDKVASANPAAMSTYDIAMALERGEIDISLLPQEVVDECALIYRSRRYPISQIAAILKVTARTVSRHVSRARKKNAIKASPGFQAEFVGDSLNNLWAQYARLIRWSYSDELSEADKIRATLSACQIQKYAIELMERLGYLNQKNTELNMKSELTKKYGYESREKWVLDLDFLSGDQLYLAASAQLQKEQEMNKFMEKLVNSLVKESKLKPFEFLPEDIEVYSLQKILSSRLSTNCDCIVLRNLGIEESEKKSELSAIAAEQFAAAFNAIVQMPGLARETNAKFLLKGFSSESRLVISRLIDSSSKKKYDVKNLNARLLAEFYGEGIQDSYKKKLAAWEGMDTA